MSSVLKRNRSSWLGEEILGEEMHVYGGGRCNANTITILLLLLITILYIYNYTIYNNDPDAEI